METRRAVLEVLIVAGLQGCVPGGVGRHADACHLGALPLDAMAVLQMQEAKGHGRERPPSPR